MTLPALEFIRRFLPHVPPEDFHHLDMVNAVQELEAPPQGR